MKVICDTGVISRLLTNDLTIFNFVQNNIGYDNIVITPMNKIELLNWISGYKDLTKEGRAKLLKAIKAFPIIHINEAISKLAIDMSDKYINSKPADTFIGAIAKYHKTPIYTINTKDFEVLKVPHYK